MLNVFQPQREEARYMIVRERVEDLPARFAGANEMHLPQPTQLVRYRRFAHCESICQGANAHLALEQNGNNAHAAGIAEGAEEFRKLDRFEFGQFHLMNI